MGDRAKVPTAERIAASSRPSVLVAVMALLSWGTACATYFPVNHRLEIWNPQQGYRNELVERGGDSEQLLLLLAFSGGGTRAAAFAYGVLEELADTEVYFDGKKRSLIDEVDSVSSVSGGSFTATYFGLHGRRIFDDFYERFLRRNVQLALLFRLAIPWNWLRLFSPYWARSDLAAEYYDRQLFDGATFADLADGEGPFVQIHATDLTTGSPFSFVQKQFDYLCSDLSSYRVSRAVAASSAVPGLLSPVTLRNHTECGFDVPASVREAARAGRTLDRNYLNANSLLSYLDPSRRFVRLIDGASSDNLGVRGPFEPWQRERPPPLRREAGDPTRSVVLIVVNAQTEPDVEWDRFDVLPSLLSIVDAAASAQVNRYNFETIELLRRTFQQWNATTAQWDPPLHYRLIEVSFLDVPDPLERRFLNRLPTSLHLGREEVDRLRAAARSALRRSPGFDELIRELDPGRS